MQDGRSPRIARPPAPCRHRLTRAAHVVSLAAVAAAVYACRAPTEMTIRVTTTVPCKTLKGVGIAAAPTSAEAEHRAETKFYAAETTQCDSDSVVGTLVMTPGSNSFSVIVVAGVDSEVTSCLPPLYAGCIVARRRLAFVDHKSLDVPIALTRDCLDVPCNTDTSCDHGNCKPVDTTCNDTSCTQVGATPEGDGGNEDGGGVDGGVDGSRTDADHGDAGVDAADAAMVDAADAQTLFAGQYACFASPACPPSPGTPSPCSCSGPVWVDAGGVNRTTTMFVECAVGQQTCNCVIEGQLANTIVNTQFCNQNQYGACCTH